MRFDRQGDPSPLPASVAVARGQRLVNWPVRLLLLAGFGTAYFLRGVSTVFATVVAVSGFAFAWLWWSYFIPQWRAWALGRGADAGELQRLGVRGGLVWRKGSVFELTEIHRGKR
jgi:hypothetical protein